MAAKDMNKCGHLPAPVGLHRVVGIAASSVRRWKRFRILIAVAIIPGAKESSPAVRQFHWVEHPSRQEISGDDVT